MHVLYHVSDISHWTILYVGYRFRSQATSLFLRHPPLTFCVHDAEKLTTLECKLLTEYEIACWSSEATDNVYQHQRVRSVEHVKHSVIFWEGITASMLMFSTVASTNELRCYSYRSPRLPHSLARSHYSGSNAWFPGMIMQYVSSGDRPQRFHGLTTQLRNAFDTASHRRVSHCPGQQVQSIHR